MPESKKKDPGTEKSAGSIARASSDVHPFWDFWGPIFITFCLYLGIRYYIAEARYIPSGSMLPSLQVQDRLLIEKVTFRRRSPRRGDIVVFNSPYSFDPILKANRVRSPIQCTLVTFPLISLIPGLTDPACDAYIKRVVAVAGDNVSISSKGEVSINNVVKDEPYVDNYCSFVHEKVSKCKSLTTKVPTGHVLVLGDNRANSWDGRFWPGSHFLPEKEIFGRAFLRFWPVSRIGFIRY